jgi:hypothetical protein
MKSMIENIAYEVVPGLTQLHRCMPVDRKELRRDKGGGTGALQ